MTQHTHANGPWPGTWLVNCDVCGINISSDQIRKRWDGLLVCKKDWEEDHPQKYIRVGPDPIAVPIKRPESTDGTGDQFIPQCNTFTRQAIAGVAVAGCTVTGTFTNVSLGGSFTDAQIAQEILNSDLFDPFYQNTVFLYIGGSQVGGNRVDQGDSPFLVSASMKDSSPIAIAAGGGTLNSPISFGVRTDIQLFSGQSFRTYDQSILTSQGIRNNRTDLTIGTGDFTFEFAEYCVAIQAGAGNTLLNFQTAANTQPTWALNQNSTDFPAVNYSIVYNSAYVGGDVFICIDPRVTKGLNVWTRWAITRQNGTVRIYIDGTQIGQVFDPSAYNMRVFNLGGSQTGFGGNNYRFWDQIRFTKGVARYTGSSYRLASRTFPKGNFILPDPFWTNVIYLGRFNTNFADVSTNPVTTQAFGNAAINTVDTKWTGNLKTVNNGVGNGVRLTGINSGATFANGEAFTVEFWVKPNTRNEFTPLIWFGTSATNQFYIFTQFGALYTGTNLGTFFTTNLDQIGAGGWTHVAFTRNSSNLCYIYVNGQGSAYGSATLNQAVGNSLAIGIGNSEDMGGSFNVELDDIRITRGVDRYNGDPFAPPEGPYPNF